jgi:CRP-like cAMP-binding protein
MERAFSPNRLMPLRDAIGNAASNADYGLRHYTLGRQPNILSRLAPAEIKKVVSTGSVRRFAKGEAVFSQGECHESVYLIEEGLVRTFYTSPVGREITLAYWRAGNLVGTPQVLDTSINMWSGVAMAETVGLSLRAGQMRALMESIPALAISIVETLEFKGKCLSALLQMLGTQSVAERLGMLLCNLAELHGAREKDGIGIGPPFTHEVMGQMVGASRQWVTMTLDQFERAGAIRTGKCYTLILRPELLLRLQKPPMPKRKKARSPSIS